MRVLDFFSGIGGFSLGLERAGMETVAFCEYDEPCRKVLRKHWPGILIYPDIRELTDFPAVDVMCGGFPCPRFSTASHGVRVAEDLWPYMNRVIDIGRPRIVIAENVSKKAIYKAAEDLRSLGYANIWTQCISAKQAGANHIRRRWWLCAHPYNESEFQRAIDAETQMLPELCKTIWTWKTYARAIRVVDGVPRRVDRLKQLGNAVVPQIPETIARAIMAINCK